MGDKESVITNYGFYGMTYKKFEQWFGNSKFI
jgi:hypothetical protein